MVALKSSPSIKKYLFFVFFCTILLHLGTFAGYDTDFQCYSLYSKLVFAGQTPYLDFFTHKPPLYFYLLVPGNLLGGGLFSFFVVQLIYLGLTSIVVFYCGLTLNEHHSTFRGLWSWLFFSLVTVIQFFKYGNLNGSIVYLAFVFNLITFILLLRMNRALKDGQNANNLAFIAGICCGLSFLVRFGIVSNFLFLGLLLYFLCWYKIPVKEVVFLLTLFSVGFFATIILTFVVLGLPPNAAYDYLIVYNSHYSREQQPWKLYRLYEYGKYLYSYSIPLVLVCLSSLAFYTKREWKKLSRHQLQQFIDNTPLLMLITHLIGSLILVSLQGCGPKQYPFFPALAILSLIAAYALEYLVSTACADTQKGKKIVSTIGIMLLITLSSVKYLNSSESLAQAIKPPETRLIKDIKKHLKHDQDLFNIDFLTYIYLETDTIPPISRHFYLLRNWDLFGLKPEMNEQLWQQLEEKAPTVVTTHANRKNITRTPQELKFLDKYSQIGIYRTNYCAQVALYLRKPAL